MLEIAEQLTDLAEIGLLVDGGVRADQKSGLLGRLDACNRLLEDAWPFDRQVVGRLEAIEVHVEEEARRWTKLLQPLADEHSVRAEIDVALLLDQCGDQP